MPACLMISKHELAGKVPSLLYVHVDDKSIVMELVAGLPSPAELKKAGYETHPEEFEKVSR